MIILQAAASFGPGETPFRQSVFRFRQSKTSFRHSKTPFRQSKTPFRRSKSSFRQNVTPFRQSKTRFRQNASGFRRLRSGLVEEENDGGRTFSGIRPNGFFSGAEVSGRCSVEYLASLRFFYKIPDETAVARGAKVLDSNEVL
jgi:hypothetical protein